MQAGGDKVVKNLVKKVNAHPLGVDEINFFRDDNTILHFKNPEGTHHAIQPTPPFPTTPSSSLANLKPRLSKICCRTSCSSWDLSSISCCRIWSPTCPRVPKKCPIWCRLQPALLRIWIRWNDLSDGTLIYGSILRLVLLFDYWGGCYASYFEVVGWYDALK